MARSLCDRIGPSPDFPRASAVQGNKDAKSGNPASYTTRAFTYIYQSDYGRPDVGEVIPQLTKAVVGADNKPVRLTLDKLTKGHTHEPHLNGLKSVSGLPALQPVACYTLNEIPTKERQQQSGGKATPTLLQADVNPCVGSERSRHAAPGRLPF
ncbi:MAG: hypothetical protein ACKV19_06350 [Verrucomicrobiales bacterium]